MSVDEPLKEKVSYYVLLHTEEFQIERNIISWISLWVNLLREKNRTIFFFTLKDNKKKNIWRALCEEPAGYTCIPY